MLWKQLGSLEKGKLADIVILDGSRVPTPLNASSVIGHLLNTFSGKDVRDVFVNGVQCIKESELALISDKKVTDVSRQSAERLWSKL